MRKIVSLLSIVLLGTTTYYAQAGINTPDPGSTLHVNGSFAAQYRAITATTYAMNATDYYVSYNGTGNATFSLPPAIAGTGNFKGRLYTIKNNTTSTVTINPTASETIGGNANIALAANQSVQIINTGLTGAAVTWEVIAYNSSNTGIGCVPDYMFATIPGSLQSGVSGNTNINFNLIKSSSGSGIALNNGVFTLQAGKTYELEGHLFGVSFSNPTGGFMSGQWVDASNNSPLIGSTTAEFYAVTYTTTNNSEMQVSKAIITPSTNLTVSLRILTSNGTADMRGNQSYAIIKQLNSCGGGGTPTPGTTYNGSASVTLNGSTFERAALTGDATAAANSNVVTVTGLQGRLVSSSVPATNDLLSYNGTNWAPLPTSALGIPKQVVSVSVPGTQNIVSGSIVQFTVKNYDPNNSWVNNEYIVPTGLNGTYNLNLQLSNQHTASLQSTFWVMIHIEKSTDGGASYTRVASEIRTSAGPDYDNSIGMFWTGNMNVGDRLRVKILSSADTNNLISQGNLALTKL